jgi:hypothetical protein
MTSNVVNFQDFLKPVKPAALTPTQEVYEAISKSTTPQSFQEYIEEILDLPGDYQSQLDSLMGIRDNVFTIAFQAHQKFLLGQWVVERIADKHISIVASMLGYTSSPVEVTF